MARRSFLVFLLPSRHVGSGHSSRPDSHCSTRSQGGSCNWESQRKNLQSWIEPRRACQTPAWSRVKKQGSEKAGRQRVCCLLGARGQAQGSSSGASAVSFDNRNLTAKAVRRVLLSHRVSRVLWLARHTRGEGVHGATQIRGLHPATFISQEVIADGTPVNIYLRGNLFSLTYSKKTPTCTDTVAWENAASVDGTSVSRPCS